MKWKNKGHEYDEVGAIFKNASRLYIYGDNYEGKNAYRLISFLNTPVVMVRSDGKVLDDMAYGMTKAVGLLKRRDVASIVRQIKRRTGRTDGGVYKDKEDADLQYCTKEEMSKDPNAVIVVSMHDGKAVDRIADETGLPKGKQVLGILDFLKRMLAVYMLYKHDIVYFKCNDLIVTTRCTLNCEKCLNFNPYNHDRKDFELEKLKGDIDLFFGCVDRVGEFGISGGEPLLHKELPNLLKYIGENYRDCIYILYIVTNGMVMPDEELINIMERYDISMKIDNYATAVPSVASHLEHLMDRLKNSSIQYELFKVMVWFDLFPCKENLRGLTPAELIDRYDKCDNGFMELKDGKICTCNYVGFAATAGVVEREWSDYFNLREFDKERKAELVEFRNGYSEKGYTNFCKICNGFPSINKQKPVPSAVQVKGYLTYERGGE